MKTPNKNIEVLRLAIAEADRFIKRAEAARERLIENEKSEYGQFSFKEMGAVKRSAHDLKRELTNITQLKY